MILVMFFNKELILLFGKKKKFSKEEFENIKKNFYYQEDDENFIIKPLFIALTNRDIIALNKGEGVLCPDENIMLIPVDIDDVNELKENKDD